ncbi:MAG: HTH domain-containing protein, partial [Acidobacteria bacterium]|nr:HTH domain-containing protein [Acidobacteriota bacterium]
MPKHPPRVELMRTLADGRWHSGETLAKDLGVSRTAVWKRLRELESLGLELHKLTGRGYRLARPLELLDAELIARELVPAHRAAPEAAIHRQVPAPHPDQHICNAFVLMAWISGKPFTRAVIRDSTEWAA